MRKIVPDGPWVWSCREAKYDGSGVSKAVPRSERMVVQSVWHEFWKRRIRAAEEDRGEGRGWRLGWGVPMLNASLGSPCCGRLIQRLFAI